jgi:hypothetical protein
MLTDPNDPGQGPGGPGFGATGSQPPQTAADAKRIADLEAENATLREERRQERAKTLGVEHGLTPTEVSLLSGLKADEMATTAAKLAEERKAITPPPTTPPTGEPAPTSTPAAEPPNAGALAAMQSGGEGAPSAIQTPPANSTEAMWAEVNAATSYEDVVRIQQKYKRMSLEE